MAVRVESDVMKRGVRRAAVILATAAMVAGAWTCLLCAPWPIPELSVKAFGAFRFDPVRGTLADVPADLRSLDGRRVSVVGGMYTTDYSSKRFQLVSPCYSFNFRWPNGP